MDVVTSLLEGTILVAPAMLGLTVLSVWLGWHPVPHRAERGRRVTVAVPAAVAAVAALYLLGAISGGGDLNAGEALLLLVPAVAFFIVGLAAVLAVYLGREHVTIRRLMVFWALATATFGLAVIAVIAVIASLGGFGAE